MSGIFISYRRSDNPDATGRIYDRLVAEFGKAQVFKDVDSIPLGQDFRRHLNDIVAHCGVMLAIVGPGWMDVRNKAGTRRLDEPDDFVRIELEAALARDIPVVPVRVGHAPIPLASELPQSLSSMAFRQSIEVRPDPDFHNDVTKLVGALRGILGPDAPRPEQPIGSGAATGRVRAWMGAVAASVLLAAALAYPALKYLSQTPTPETRTDIVTPATDEPGSFALSPDGRYIAYVARGDGTSLLWLRSLAKATAQPLAGTEGARSPFWSPDSKSIGFFSVGSLKRLDLDGGQPQTLTRATLTGRGTWSSKGIILFSASSNDPLSRIAATGGPVTALPPLGEGAIGNLYPEFLPDGQHFLVQSTHAATAGTAGMSIELASLDTDEAVRLTDLRQAVVNASPATYLPSSNRLLWIRPDNILVSQRLDLSSQQLVGEIVSLADAVDAVSASAAGLVAYRISTGSGQRQLTWVDRTGAVHGTVGTPDESLSEPRLSPDGKRVAFELGSPGNRDIWLQEGSRTTRLTFGNGDNDSPVWSPDGSQLAFRNEDKAEVGFYRKRADGAGAQEPLLISERPKFPTSWSRNGYLLYFWVTDQTALDISVLPVNGSRESYEFLHNDLRNAWPMFSPDGRWVAYQSNATGRFEIFVRPFVKPDTGGATAQSAQWQVSTTGGSWPVWSDDGKELYFIDAGGMMMAAQMRFSESGAIPGTPVALFQANILGGGNDAGQGRQYDVAKDGRFLINRTLNEGTAPITLIQNWNPDSAQ